MLLVEEAYLIYRHVVDVICEPEVAGRFPLNRLSCIRGLRHKACE